MTALKNNRGKNWTKEEDEILRRMHKKYTFREISERLGRTVNSVNSRVGRMSLSRSSKRSCSQPGVLLKVKAMKFNKNDYYEVHQMYRGTKISFKGKVIHETTRHVTLENNCRRETFLKVDFIIGEYKIKEVI